MSFIYKLKTVWSHHEKLHLCNIQLLPIVLSLTPVFSFWPPTKEANEDSNHTWRSSMGNMIAVLFTTEDRDANAASL